LSAPSGAQPIALPAFSESDPARYVYQFHLVGACIVIPQTEAVQANVLDSVEAARVAAQQVDACIGSNALRPDALANVFGSAHHAIRLALTSFCYMPANDEAITKIMNALLPGGAVTWFARTKALPIQHLSWAYISFWLCANGCNTDLGGSLFTHLSSALVNAYGQAGLTVIRWTHSFTVCMLSPANTLWSWPHAIKTYNECITLCRTALEVTHHHMEAWQLQRRDASTREAYKLMQQIAETKQFIDQTRATASVTTNKRQAARTDGK